MNLSWKIEGSLTCPLSAERRRSTGPSMFTSISAHRWCRACQRDHSHHFHSLAFCGSNLLFTYVCPTSIFCAISDKAPTNKICRRASSEQRPRTRSCHESERLVLALFRSKRNNVVYWKTKRKIKNDLQWSNVPFGKTFFPIQFARSWGFQPAATGEFLTSLGALKCHKYLCRERKPFATAGYNQRFIYSVFTKSDSVLSKTAIFPKKEGRKREISNESARCSSLREANV